MRTWIEIKEKNIENNYKEFRKLIGPKCLLMAVVKSNAYGHNLLDFSLIVEKLQVDWLGVDSIIEAETLRKLGVKKPMLVLGYTVKYKIKEAIENNVSITVADFPTLKEIKKEKSNKKLNIHIKVDTGMHRQGFYLKELPRVIKEVKKLPVNIEGIYTHFAAPKNPAFPKETEDQIKEFKEAIKLFSEFNGIIKHASSTSGTIVFPNGRFDMVRIGIGMYGIWPSAEVKAAFDRKINLKPVLSWKSILGELKNIPKGGRIGYDFTETLTRNSKVAVIPIGYWHGFPRALSSIGEVIIRGKKAKVLGRVSMDMISVDVTDIKEARIGDEVTLIGKEKSAEITADEIARLTGTSAYEIVTRLNPRIKRVVT